MSSCLMSGRQGSERKNCTPFPNKKRVGIRSYPLLSVTLSLAARFFSCCAVYLLVW